MEYRGAPDPDAAYLRELRAHHGEQAVMVTGSGTISHRRVGAVGIEGAGSRIAYDWDGWTAVRWHERRKAGWDALSRPFAASER